MELSNQRINNHYNAAEPLDAPSMGFEEHDGTRWSGIPIWQIISWAKGQGAIGDSDLASGYTVKVIGRSGTAVFNSSEIAGTWSNWGLILASRINDAPLTGNMYPLTVAGLESLGLAEDRKVQGVTEIQILPIQASTATTDEPTPT